MVTATEGPTIDHGDVFLVGRDTVKLTWRDIDGCPASLYRHRHNYEIVLGLKEATIQIFLPCEANEQGTATFLAVCDSGAHADLSLNIGLGKTMGFAVTSYPFSIYKGADDCPEGMAMASKELYLLSVAPGIIHGIARAPGSAASSFSFIRS